MQEKPQPRAISPAAAPSRNRRRQRPRKRVRRAGTLLCAGMLAASLALGGCAGASATASTAGGSDAAAGGDWRDPEATTIDISGMDFAYGDREASGDWDEDDAAAVSLDDSIKADGDGVAVDGSTVTISQAGTYVFSGKATDAQVVVNAGDDDKVQIVLNGASITCADGPALFVENADKVYVTNAAGTENALADTAANDAVRGSGDDAESLNAAVYAKDDLCFNGTGTLNMTGASAHAVKGKDDIVFAGGTYTVTAVKDGIRAGDSVKARQSAITADAGSDGIKVTNAEDGDKGFVSIDDGTAIDITAGDDGIEASRYLRVTGGTASVTAADDALHSDIDGLVSGGTLNLEAGDDAFHAEFDLGVSGGEVNVSSCYEGLEGQQVIIGGGSVNIVASDDGVNAAEGSVESSGSGQSSSAEGDASDRQARAPMGDDGVSELVIEGGTLTVQAGGDGLDSNGSLLMTDGTVFVSGPENGANGSIDTGGEAVIKGGTFIAAGSAGMAEDFGGASTQASAFIQANGQSGDTVSVVDATGRQLVSFQPAADFSCVIASTPDMEAGATYTAQVNGKDAGSAEAGTDAAAGGMNRPGDRGDAMDGMRGQDGMGPQLGDAGAERAPGANGGGNAPGTRPETSGADTDGRGSSASSTATGSAA